MSARPGPTATAVTTLWTRRGSQVLAGAAASVSFTGLTDAAYRVSGSVIPTAASVLVQARFNNDSASTYVSSIITLAQSTQQSTVSTTLAQMTRTADVPAAGDYPMVFTLVVQKPLAAKFGLAVLHGGLMANTGSQQVFTSAGWKWPNTADLITRIDIIASTSTFKIGSHFTVEGMA